MKTNSKPGSPEYVCKHSQKRANRGKNPSTYLLIGDQKITNPKAALHLAKLLVNDTEKTLLGKPFFRSEIDWAEKYQEHLSGPNGHIPFGPTSGIDMCICGMCFYRDAPPPHNPKFECQMVGRSPQKYFGFSGPAKKVYMPAMINGKDLGSFCHKWLSLFAD